MRFVVCVLIARYAEGRTATMSGSSRAGETGSAEGTNPSRTLPTTLRRGVVRAARGGLLTAPLPSPSLLTFGAGEDGPRWRLSPRAGIGFAVGIHRVYRTTISPRTTTPRIAITTDHAVLRGQGPRGRGIKP